MSLGERMTSRARAVLKMAKDVAAQLNAGGIDTHHVLIAIWKEGTGVAVNALINLGVTEEQLKKAAIQAAKDDVANNKPSDKLLFTEDTKTIIAEADAQSKKLEHKVIGTEHILLAILQHTSCKGCKILAEFKINHEQVRDEIVRLLGESEFSGSAGPAGAPAYKDAPEKIVSGTRSKKSKKELPFVDKFCVDITARAEEGKLDPTIGRRTEIERIMQILGRKTKNNPVLIGESGVGKSKIIEGIAQAIVSGTVPDTVRGKRLYSVDLAAMIAGTKYRGQFEERIKGLLKEVEDCKDIILFFDELHTMVGAGSSEGSMDASNIMKPALSRGDLQCIGATTLDEYRKHIEKDGALSRRFQPVLVDPTTRDQTIKILEGLQPSYEAHHGVKYTHTALEAAVELADRFISDRFLPDKAIDVLDEAGSRVKMKSTFKPKEVQDLEQQFQDKTLEKDKAVRDQKYELAAQLRDETLKLKEKLETREKEWREGLQDVGIIDEEVIASIIAGMTGIPVTQVTEEEGKRLLHIEEELHKSVISQHEAIEKVAEAIRRSRAGVGDPKRPVACFLFVGPTGVGKTLLCKSLAKLLFGTEDALLQLDMSEYMEKHNVSRLVGAPPGYVGYEEGGQLTEKVRRKPYSIVLFDEIEKAHPDVFNILLQIMEEGKLTDSFGRKVNFKNTILVMTSNVGSDLLRSNGGLGFVRTTEDASYEQMKKTLEEEISKTFKPEFINRLDEIVTFQKLTREDMADILEVELKYLRNRLHEQNLELVLTDEAKKFLITEGYSEIFGARPLKRMIRKHIENPLSCRILEGKFQNAKTITVTRNEIVTGINSSTNY